MEACAFQIAQESGLLCLRWTCTDSSCTCRIRRQKQTCGDHQELFIAFVPVQRCWSAADPLQRTATRSRSCKWQLKPDFAAQQSLLIRVNRGTMELQPGGCTLYFEAHAGVQLAHAVMSVPADVKSLGTRTWSSMKTRCRSAGSSPERPMSVASERRAPASAGCSFGPGGRARNNSSRMPLLSDVICSARWRLRGYGGIEQCGQ